MSSQETAKFPGKARVWKSWKAFFRQLDFYPFLSKEQIIIVIYKILGTICSPLFYTISAISEDSLPSEIGNALKLLNTGYFSPSLLLRKINHGFFS